MGCGPGPGRGIPLSEYQEQVGDAIMTVSGDDYTFVANHTIPAEDEIIFGATDTLTINAGVDVILEGKLYVIDETDGITRISIQGTLTMEEGSEIEICGIRNGGIGIQVTSGTFTQNGGDIRITNVNSSIALDVNSQFNANAGAINIGSVLNGAQGINVRTAGQFSQSGANINITNVDGAGSDGIRVNDAGSNFTLSGGSIQIISVTNEGQGIDIINEGVFVQNGVTSSITITNVSGSQSTGIGLDGTNSFFTTSAGTINIGSISIGGVGINAINNSLFVKTGGDITISSVDSPGLLAQGILLNNSNFNTSSGTIQIDSLSNSVIGIHITNESVFAQTGGDISITTVDNFSRGIVVEDPFSTMLADSGTIQIDTVSNSSLGIELSNTGVFAQDAAYDITFGKLTTNATAIQMSSDSTFTKADGATITINDTPTGGGTSGMVVTGTITGSVVTNLGPNDSIDMTNSNTPYTPPIDPFGNPWDGGASSRAFYAPP